MPPRNLLVVGASARAAAQSAAHAGYTVAAVDLFADVDLCACAETLRCGDYPDGLVELSANLPPGPWLYTGGLENHPDIVATISKTRPLWGNCAEVLRRVRDPLLLYQALRTAGLPAIEVTLDPSELPRDGSWLTKSRAGSGGKHVQILDEHSAVGHNGERTVGPNNSRRYFQRRQIGIAAAAIFVGNAGRGRFLGLTEQLLGEDWSGGDPFQYAGSIAPCSSGELAHNERYTAELTRLGDTLAAAFGLVGLFGVDGVIHDGHFWPVEVNPRYTASCEVIERYMGLNMIALHAAACDEQRAFSTQSLRGSAAVGKLIVYATADGTFTPQAAQWCEILNAEPDGDRAADIPRVGTPQLAGEPVLTVLTHGDSSATVREQLSILANELRRQLV